MNKTIIKDAIISGFLGGLVSYLVSINRKNPDYLKMMAFIYAAPCIFFYMVLISSRKGKQAIKSFSFHALLGILLTASVIIFTYLFYYLNRNLLVAINLFIFLFITALYFKYKIYKL